MYAYALLEAGCNYIIQEKDELPVTMIKVTMETDYCMCVAFYGETTVLEWRRKTDPILDILELVGDDKVKEWETIYNDNQGAYYEEDDD